MISLTRLSGSVFLLNADLIERVDCTPDTVITLVDGKKYVVADPLESVLDAVVAYRAEIVALGSLLDSGDEVRRARRPRAVAERTTRLAAVPAPGADGAPSGPGGGGS